MVQFLGFPVENMPGTRLWRCLVCWRMRLLWPFRRIDGAGSRPADWRKSPAFWETCARYSSGSAWSRWA